MIRRKKPTPKPITVGILVYEALLRALEHDASAMMLAGVEIRSAALRLRSEHPGSDQADTVSIEAEALGRALIRAADPDLSTSRAH